MVRETEFQSQVESYQRLKKWYLISACLALSIIRYVSMVKWSNPGKGVAPFPTPRCKSYWKGNLRVIVDYGRQLYFTCTNPILFISKRPVWPIAWNLMWIKMWFRIDHRLVLPITNDIGQWGLVMEFKKKTSTLNFQLDLDPDCYQVTLMKNFVWN